MQTALPIPHTQALGDIAQHMDPASLARHSGVDEVEGGVEPAVPIGGDQLQDLASETATGEVHQEGLPRALALGLREAVVDQVPPARRRDPIRDENATTPCTIRGFDAQMQPVEEKVAVVVPQWAPMPGGDGVVEGARNTRDGRGTDGLVQELGERGADPAGADAGEEDSLDEAIHRGGALLIARDDRRGEATEAAARDLQIRDGPPGGREAPAIEAIRRIGCGATKRRCTISRTHNTSSGCGGS